jgi:hypothetical protein
MQVKKKKKKFASSRQRDKKHAQSFFSNHLFDVTLFSGLVFIRVNRRV